MTRDLPFQAINVYLVQVSQPPWTPGLRNPPSVTTWHYCDRCIEHKTCVDMTMISDLRCVGQLVIDRYKSFGFDIPTVEQGDYQKIVQNSGGKTIKTCLFAHFRITTEEIIGKGRGVKRDQ